MAITAIQNDTFRISAFGVACGLAAVLGSAGSTWAAPGDLKPLHEFCEQANCLDGARPYFPPVADSNGVVYGSTTQGGANGAGVAYALIPKGKALSYKVLYDFCPGSGACTDGQEPESPVIYDTAGNIYGTTARGGAFGFGTLYALIHKGNQWTHKTLYDFCQGGASPCADGQNPAGRLAYKGSQTGAPYDGKSPLYGAASGGKGDGGVGQGVIFQVTPGKGRQAKEQVLYTYCSLPDCTDGATVPGAPGDVMIDGNGNLYSATTSGGQYNAGAVTEIDPKKKVESVLYSFCPMTNCTDGSGPVTPLAMDAKGNLFGTTDAGGTTNFGVVFKITPNGVHSTETVLYSFCAKKNCVDGAKPFGGVTIDSSGNLFGTTQVGGAFTRTHCDGQGHGCGTLFQLHGSIYKVLHSFCKTGTSSCADGGGPLYGPLTLDQQGNVYGATFEGGTPSAGVIFKLTP
jgi:uncharacterized repeat protein (TIGR03803 family)